MINLALQIEPNKTALTFVKNGQVLTDSRTIAATFGKRHDIVLRSIRNFDCPSDFNARNFVEVEYTDEKGERRPAFDITRDGFVLLVMGFTGKRAMQFKIAYIEAFNKMEAELMKPTRTICPAYEEHAFVSTIKTAVRDLCLTENSLRC